MYAQLGTTIFDGLKSFVSFSQEEEVILVEHALIGRKPKMQGAGLGLQTLSLTLFLHQEFCNIEQEVAQLRKSKDSFEVLPLLWGNGKVEGQFVIKQLSIDKLQQDNIGNTYAANVAIILKESVSDNVDQAGKSAFAAGDKEPSSKSNRKNRESCEKQISDTVSRIRSNGGSVNTTMARFSRAPLEITFVKVTCGLLINDCASIIVATDTRTSCIYNNDTIRVAANNVRAIADGLRGDIGNFSLPISSLKDENTLLQTGIGTLVKVTSKMAQKAIIP